MEYLSRLVVDDVQALVLVAEPTPVGITTVRRISELADSLDLKIKRRILAINKVGQVASVEVPDVGDISKVDEVIHVPFDADLFGRCSRGEPVDDQAGTDARAAVERIAAACLGL